MTCRSTFGTAVMVVALAASCRQKTGPSEAFVPGPAAPNVPTALPLTWDSADELAAWLSPTTRGPVTVVGPGQSAFLRIVTGAVPFLTFDEQNFCSECFHAQSVLRGPDLDPAVVVSGWRLRFRWVQSRPAGTTDCRCWNPDFLFRPATAPYRSGLFFWDAGGRLQPTVDGTPHASDWREAFFGISSAPSIQHVYAVFSQTFPDEWPGMFDIDWIKLERP